MLCAPCFAAIGAIKREMGSWKWTWITLGFQTGTAYLVALLINQVGNVLFYGGNIIGALISIAIVVAIIAGILLSNKKSVNINSNVKLSYIK
ncbi:Fe2+ transport system protein B [Clostridioides difficile]|nr:Fe2+ transport system protein B [Clostridioides difficile]